MMRTKLTRLFCIFCIFQCFSCATIETVPRAPGGVTLILGAFDAEVAPLRGRLENMHDYSIEGIEVVTGRMYGRNVAIAWTGIGKVNAAMTSTLLMEYLRPSEVIFTGIAGALNPALEPGDIVIAQRTAQHDLGVWLETGLKNRGEINRFTGQRNPTFFMADKRLLRLAELAAEQGQLESIEGRRAARVITGVVVTGDTFVMSASKCAQLRADLGAEAVEMEGAAVAQICYQWNVPFIAIRAITDRADKQAMGDVETFQHVAAKNAAEVTAGIVRLLTTNCCVN